MLEEEGGESTGLFEVLAEVGCIRLVGVGVGAGWAWGHRRVMCFSLIQASRKAGSKFVFFSLDASIRMRLCTLLYE